MATAEKRIEVFKLTISGLPDGTRYDSVIMKAVAGRSAADLTVKYGRKSHAISKISDYEDFIFLRFISFTKGHRPDIINTLNYDIHPNPLSESETGVEWTHILGGYSKHDQFTLLIEHNYNGLHPSTLEFYLQRLLSSSNQTGSRPEDGKGDEDMVLSVSVEVVPGTEFLKRLEALSRVTEAKLRIVRPNPGWGDLETELGDLADSSSAHKADIIMNANRGRSLSTNRGLLQWIKDKFHARTLGHAAIKGRIGNRIDTFTTEKLGKASITKIEIDDRGQIKPDDAAQKLKDYFRELD